MPVGPEPSAVLANAVLAWSIGRSTLRRPCRWVDDVVVAVRLARRGRDVRPALDALGLAATREMPDRERSRRPARRRLGAFRRAACPWHDAPAVDLYRAARIHPRPTPRRGTGSWSTDGTCSASGSASPQADRVVDLPGTTIVPGFIDAHVHLTEDGLSLANENVRAARSADDLLSVVRERATEGDGPLFLLGYDESAWEPPDLPTIADLDEACGRPLMIRRADGHIALANRAALEAGGVLDRPGIDRDAGGGPTGVVTQQANDALGLWALSSIDDLARQDLQLRAASLAASRGVTAVHEMSMPHWSGEADLRVLLDHRARLPVDAAAIPATSDLATAIGSALTAIGGDLPVDGSIGARTAWIGEAYLEGGNGVAYFADDELAEFFHGAHAAGLQVGVHAIGDRAIEQVLAVWERVYHALDSPSGGTSGPDGTASSTSRWSRRRRWSARRCWGSRHRFNRRSTRPGGSRRALRAAARTLARREHESVPHDVGSRGRGRRRLRRPDHPLDPMLAIEALERHHDPAQRLSRREAIRLHTIGSARVAHQEDKKGALAPGMHADLAAFDADPFEEPSVDGLRPVLTVSLGREVFAT